MQVNRYRLSQGFIASRIRDPIRGAFVFSFFIILVSALCWLTAFWPPWLSASLAAILIAIMFGKNRKLSALARSRLPTVVIELSSEAISFIENGEKHVFSLSSIALATVQRRQDQISAIFLKLAAGSSIKVEGLENFNQFNAQLSKEIGSSRIREIKWWQPSPS